ncbi:MAG: DUF262 domain-containing protein [Chloracidobacterium sp.]|nr:DUF262 domain-containing protein [Chloracidobacterium sp.]
MSIFEDTNPRELKELLNDIHSRNMVLPDFQRDFVWDPWMTQELIISIANNFPAGTLLRVRDTKSEFFAPRAFQGAPDISGHKHTFLVLDGQQRLTSLYQAFFGVGEHRYFLNLKKLLDGADFEEGIFHLRTTTKKVKAFDNEDVQAAELVVPLSVLRNGSGGFSKWCRAVARKLKDAERIKLEDELCEVEERWIQTIDDYKFPVVTLAESTSAEALCTIFETLNRTGVKLSVFELLTARFWPKGVKLRELWETAVADHPIILEYNVDPYYLLQAIAICSRPTPGCKRSEVLELTADNINDWWPKVVRGLVAGLEILRDDCRVLLPRWLPYQPMLLTLAALLGKSGKAENPPDEGVRREKIKQWFWCASFGQAYESGANTQAVKDTGEMLTWFGGGEPPDSVQSVRFDPAALRDVTPRQRAIYSATICLILCSGTRDFHKQSVITSRLMNEEGIDDHHVFPSDYLLKQKGIDVPRVRDCVLNRTLIDASTNRKISNRPPSDYMSEIKATVGFPFDAVLESHILPVGDDSPLWSNDYEAFLDWRQKRIWEEIKSVTGLTEMSDLEAVDVL